MCALKAFAGGLERKAAFRAYWGHSGEMMPRAIRVHIENWHRIRLVDKHKLVVCDPHYIVHERRFEANDRADATSLSADAKSRRTAQGMAHDNDSIRIADSVVYPYQFAFSLAKDQKLNILLVVLDPSMD